MTQPPYTIKKSTVEDDGLGPNVFHNGIILIEVRKIEEMITFSDPMISWADLDEHKKSKPINGIYQVFGHTQQKKKAVIKKSFADLDCRKAFLLTPSGNITEVKK